MKMLDDYLENDRKIRDYFKPHYRCEFKHHLLEGKIVDCRKFNWVLFKAYGLYGGGIVLIPESNGENKIYKQIQELQWLSIGGEFTAAFSKKGNYTNILVLDNKKQINNPSLIINS